MISNTGISVVIVNWNGRRWLESCLPSLAQQTYKNFETIVVDNASTDDSVSWLTREWPDVRLLLQAQNIGFSRANNIGIGASHGAFVVTLNNDTRLEPTCLSELMGAVQKSDIGMVAPAIVQWRSPQRLDSAGIEVDRAGIAWQRAWGRPLKDAAISQDIFGPSAAAALYRRAMLDQVGLFDEDYFAYYEDVDLAWRARQAGWRCRYVPGARVHHWHSATAATIPARKRYLVSRNKIWTLFKNYPSGDFLRFWPIILFYDLLSMVSTLAGPHRKAAIRGRFDALRHRHIALGKRPAAMSVVPLSPLTPPWRLAHRLRR